MKINTMDKISMFVVLVGTPCALVLWGAISALVVLASGLLLGCLVGQAQVARLRYQRAVRDLPVQRGTLAEPDDQPTSWLNEKFLAFSWLRMVR